MYLYYSIPSSNIVLLYNQYYATFQPIITMQFYLPLSSLLLFCYDIYLTSLYAINTNPLLFTWFNKYILQLSFIYLAMYLFIYLIIIFIFNFSVVLYSFLLMWSEFLPSVLISLDHFLKYFLNFRYSSNELCQFWSM